MNRALSLRMRLTLIILLPLLVLAGLLGVWAVRDAQGRAADRFDRSLLSAALAISRDVAVSDGDALSPQTNALLRDTSGGPVFYHVYAPDGVFVTGYATPPVPPAGLIRGNEDQLYYDAQYMSRDVRALRFEDAMVIDGLGGTFTFTVWQDTALRTAIVRDLSWRTFTMIAPLITAVALVVWFGVRQGLRPLLSLQDAIARRSPDDLTPIRRAVPAEARGIVETLNGLLGQLSATLRAKDDFISDAAHQLRNPIAGVLAMSEAVQRARTFDAMRERSGALVTAATEARDLANKLLALERARGTGRHEPLKMQDVSALLARIVASRVAAGAERNVTVTLDAPGGTIVAPCDPTMVREAILNLIDNALLHGGPGLTRITAGLEMRGGAPCLHVADDGKGIEAGLHGIAVQRFKQIEPKGGSGLGLAIAKAVAESHGGALTLTPLAPGLRVELTLG